MSRNLNNFDKKALYEDLKNAIREDKLYDVRNEAKIRACLTSKSYDEFRDIVAAAHLTSLDKNDKIKIGNRKWNCYSTENTTE